MTIAIEGWKKLGTCRQIGMNVGPIPWVAFDRWATRRGLDADAAELVWEVISALDADYLNGLASKRG